MDQENKIQGNANKPTESKEQPKRRKIGPFMDVTPEKLHCSRCKTLMENGECPQCGFRAYVPMDEEKMKKIRLIGTGVGLVLFALLFFFLQIMK